ncbi:epithelial membrane protein 3-like [Aphelocoma coerulescens]|uniref:epithelial membrane protein 3-like n=1 Tax=Aphelocoma coerulescens TaxID=39617 RepID=UPI0036044C4E
MVGVASGWVRPFGGVVGTAEATPPPQRSERSCRTRERPPKTGSTMSFLPAAVAALHLLVLLLLFVATLDKGWWVLPDAQALNLWYDCAPQNRSQGWECSSLGLSPLLRGVQGLMVAALLLSALGLLLFLWQLLGGPRGRLFLPAAAAQLLAGLAALLGAGLFAAGGGRAEGGRPGHCPVLAGLGGGPGAGQRGRLPAPADAAVSRTCPLGTGRWPRPAWPRALDESPRPDR